MGQASATREIYITIEVGQTQSQQLFDFNSSDNRIITNQIITGQSYLVQKGEDIVYQSDAKSEPPIYSVKIDGTCLELINATEEEHSLWRVLTQGELCPVLPGMTIKIGKIKLKLKEIVEEEKELTEKDFKSQSIYMQEVAQMKSVSGKSNISVENQCRICFDCSHNKENPLVCLCKCSGSVKYIHYSCLKDWINNKIEKRQHNNALFFSYEQTKCEICQEYYQPEFTYEGRKYMLLNLDNAPNPPYAVFEQVQAENRRFSVFLVGLGQEQITIGRNSNSTIVMKEISVSRNHCVMTYNNRTIFIRDKGSKFGTLVKVTEEIEFSPKQGISLQYESKLIKIQEKGTLGCCCAESDSFQLKVKEKEKEKEKEERELE